MGRGALDPLRVGEQGTTIARQCPVCRHRADRYLVRVLIGTGATEALRRASLPPPPWAYLGRGSEAGYKDVKVAGRVLEASLVGGFGTKERTHGRMLGEWEKRPRCVLSCRRHGLIGTRSSAVTLILSLPLHSVTKLESGCCSAKWPFA